MRIAIISDIHEDFVNLKNAFEQISKLRIDKIACLGDIIGFEKNHYSFADTRSAKKCVHLIHDKSDIIVAGNHELVASNRLPEFKDILGYPNNWYSISMKEKEEVYGHKFFLYKDEAENDLDSGDLMKIKEYKSWNIFETRESRLLFSHFIYPDINGNLKSFANNRTGFSKHFSWMKELNSNISFIGHAHINGVGIVGRKGLKVYKYGIYTLKDEQQIVICPPLVSGKSKSGFVIFDSDINSIEVKEI